MGTIGGVVLGPGLSLAAQLLQRPLTTIETAVALLSCSIGCILIAGQWMRGSD